MAGISPYLGEGFKLVFILHFPAQNVCFNDKSMHGICISSLSKQQWNFEVEWIRRNKSLKRNFGVKNIKAVIRPCIGLDILSLILYFCVVGLRQKTQLSRDGPSDWCNVGISWYYDQRRWSRNGILINCVDWRVLTQKEGTSQLAILI